MIGVTITKWNADELMLRLTIGVEPFGLTENYTRHRSDYQQYANSPASGVFDWYKGSNKATAEVARALDELLVGHPNLHALAPLYDVAPLDPSGIAADLKQIEEGLK